MAEVLTTVATVPPGKGHSKRSKLYYDMSKRVCWKYISYCKGNQDYCSVARDFLNMFLLQACCQMSQIFHSVESFFARLPAQKLSTLSHERAKGTYERVKLTYEELC